MLQEQEQTDLNKHGIRLGCNVNDCVCANAEKAVTVPAR